jgi:hypothetical protein
MDLKGLKGSWESSHFGTKMLGSKENKLLKSSIKKNHNNDY